MRVLTTEQMRRFDRWAIDTVGLDSAVLMENAAIGVVDVIGERFPDVERVLVLCGPGNNGGDGLAVARQLETRGYRTRTSLAVAESELGSEAKAQLAVCRALGLAVDELDAQGLSGDYDLVVDALFGTGLSRPLEGTLALLVEEISARPCPVLAVDLPSGIDASQSRIIGPHVRADVTVTFARPKLATVLGDTAEAAGELVVVDLGLPWTVLGDAGESWLHLLRGEEVSLWLPRRARQSHKGDYGHLLVVGGSLGMTGAVLLAAGAALRSGSGLVTAALPDAIAHAGDLGPSESMTLAFGDPGSVHFGPGAVDRLLDAIEVRDACALGPGLGSADETAAATRRVVLESSVPMVLDADGLNAFAGALASLSNRQGPLVLTPHPGELGRLLELSAAEVNAQRVERAREAARRSDSVVVLKGHQSLVADPSGDVWINPTGNSGMATGGAGDVLTGVVGSLLGQGFEALAAAQIGAYVHGLAGDLAARERGERSLVAGDLVGALPAAFCQLEKWPGARGSNLDGQRVGR